MSIAINIREVGAESWADYAGLRLDGLRRSPQGFGSTYDNEKNRTPEEWRNWFGCRRQAIFIAYADQPVALALLIDSADAQDTGEVVALYVKPECRGKKISNALLAKCIEYAVENKKWGWLEARHREGNLESGSTLRSSGFSLKQSILAEWPFGEQDMRYDYVVDLNHMRRHKSEAAYHPENFKL